MANAQTEPSMDEILASIRRIIAEDEPAAAATAEQPLGEVAKPEATAPAEVEEPAEELPAVTAAPEVSGVEADATGDDFDAVFDQMETAEDEPGPVEAVELVSEQVAVVRDEPDLEDTGVLELVQEETAVEPEAVAVEQVAVQENVVDSILSDVATSSTSTSFDALQESVRLANSTSTTLEDVVKQMLNPLLKHWLDQNLPRIVEEKVEEEVRRISRRR